MPKLETRELVAGAYLGGRANLRTTHTHTVELDDHDNEIRVLCNRVQLESLADRHSLSDYARRAAPTCQACARQRRRLETYEALKPAAASDSATVLAELYAAACAVMADLDHYVMTHGPGPDARRDRLKAALDAFTELGGRS